MRKVQKVTLKITPLSDSSFVYEPTLDWLNIYIIKYHGANHRHLNILWMETITIEIRNTKMIIFQIAV
jgi:hypothetical protein